MQWIQWTQYAVDAVCHGCSGILVYGGGDIVFGAKRSNKGMQWTQWMQWTQYTVEVRNMAINQEWDQGMLGK